LWTFTTEDSIYSSPAFSGGILYVGSQDNRVYAIEGSSGRQLWNFTTGGNVDSSPAVVGGFIYVGSEDGMLYALDAFTGKLVWRYMTGDAVVSSPAISDGVVYVGSYDHLVYAIGELSQETESESDQPYVPILLATIAVVVSIFVLVAFFRKRRII
jgi:outer membrane protein assembly factor BamB